MMEKGLVEIEPPDLELLFCVVRDHRLEGVDERA